MVSFFFRWSREKLPVCCVYVKDHGVEYEPKNIVITFDGTGGHPAAGMGIQEDNQEPRTQLASYTCTLVGTLENLTTISAKKTKIQHACSSWTSTSRTYQLSHIHVAFLGLYDTVLQSPYKYSMSTSIFHMDANDNFQPTLLNKDPRVKEIWVPGCHSDCVGGYCHDGISISDSVLKCMKMEEKEAGLKFYEITKETCKNKKNHETLICPEV